MNPQRWMYAGQYEPNRKTWPSAFRRRHPQLPTKPCPMNTAASFSSTKHDGSGSVGSSSAENTRRCQSKARGPSTTSKPKRAQTARSSSARACVAASASRHSGCTPERPHHSHRGSDIDGRVRRNRRVPDISSRHRNVVTRSHDISMDSPNAAIFRPEDLARGLLRVGACTSRRLPIASSRPSAFSRLQRPWPSWAVRRRRLPSRPRPQRPRTPHPGKRRPHRPHRPR